MLAPGQSPESAPALAPASGPQGCSGTVPAGRPAGGRRALVSRGSFGRCGADTAPSGSWASTARRAWPSGSSRSAGRAARRRGCGLRKGATSDRASCDTGDYEKSASRRKTALRSGLKRLGRVPCSYGFPSGTMRMGRAWGLIGCHISMKHSVKGGCYNADN